MPQLTTNSTNPRNIILEDDDMLPEYDLATMSGGVRGKYHEAYQRGHTVRITEEDGSITSHHYTLEDGAVLLDPDVRQHFPDAAAVNHALRCLIPSPFIAKNVHWI